MNQSIGRRADFFRFNPKKRSYTFYKMRFTRAEVTGQAYHIPTFQLLTKLETNANGFINR